MQYNTKVLPTAALTVVATAVLALPACAPAGRPLAEVQRAAIADTVRRLTREVAEGAGQVSVERAFARFERGTEFAFANNGTASFAPDSVLAQFRRVYRPLRRQDIDLSAWKVTVLGPDAAVVTTHGSYTYTDSTGVTSSPRLLAWTLVWARRDGQWRVLHSHQSFGMARS